MSAVGERLARCLPGASFELEALVRLVGVVETTEVDTAAVTCNGRARLLVNPEFVATHCRRDEHLFLLVMHEMWHVLLGHTTLYERLTTAHNIAFDALINAGLSRQHPQPEYRGFFESLNPPDRFPALLLRPPVGWPHTPDYDVPGPSGTGRMLQRLYPPPGTAVGEPTWDELVAFVREHPSRPSDGDSRLIGDHEPGRADPMDDELFGDVVRRIVASWPPPPVVMTGRDAGGRPRTTWFETRPNPAPLRARFADIVRTVLRPDRSGGPTDGRTDRRVVTGPGPLPNHADRLLPARVRLIGPHALPNQVVTLRRRTDENRRRALVYLDVSGSMTQILPHVVDLLAGPARQGLLTLRQFSTTVEPLEVSRLLAGEFVSSIGTDIACVLEDVAGRREDRVLIVTDGYVGEPPAGLLDPLLQRGVRFTAAVPTDGWTRDLEPFATIHRLDQLEHART